MTKLISWKEKKNNQSLQLFPIYFKVESHK